MSGRPLHELRTEAGSLAQRGELLGARNVYFQALGQTIAREDEYVAAVGEMRNVLMRLGDTRGALTVDWYAGSERTQKQLYEQVPPIDRARTLLSWAERSTTPDRGRALYARAADEYEAAGLVARAAIARERAEDFVRARALWSRLTQILSGSGVDYYAAGLARFNLARMSKRTGETGAAREATVGAVHLLEEAADRYETIGQRERAFDCYQVLIAVGRETGEFEHVLEGYVNVIRILREDHLKYYALQSYEEAVEAAEKQGEVSAAATLAREMSVYARKEGMPSIANFGMFTQGRLWQEVAQQCQARGAPPEIAENALLAAVIASGEAGQFGKVGGLYGALAQLPLSESRRAHYLRATERCQGATDLRIDASPLPAHLRHEVGFPEVWHVDLIEWEQHGSASEACGDVILDATSWSETTRRRAILGRLTALAFEAHISSGTVVDPTTTISLAVSLSEQLAQVELYALLSPLEHLFQRPEPPVRAAVLKTLARFLFKRSFITLRAGLADADVTVSQQAAESLEELRFAHAFDPLARIYRESSNARARVAVLRALARIDTVEAAEMLMGVIEHDSPAERDAAVDALKKSRGTKFLDLAKSTLPRLSGESQAAVRVVLQQRGIAS